MKYAHFLIRQERLRHNWSQEGLCSGICTVSYLSKIEQDKAEPSDEIVQLLLERLGIHWHSDADGLDGSRIDEAYELLFSYDKDGLQKMVQQPDWKLYLQSPWGLDAQLLERLCAYPYEPLDSSLEVCMDLRQLALQWVLKGTPKQALQLYPCAWLYLETGIAQYAKGNFPQAISLSQQANQLAAQEGFVRIMLMARMLMGNCYSNRMDFTSMEMHYHVAQRLAQALGDTDSLEDITYNRAATQIELGQYKAAYKTLSQMEPNIQTLHKLAICQEKLGDTAGALATLDKAEAMPQVLPHNISKKRLRVVRLRLTEPDYLHSEAYGAALLDCFQSCRTHLAIGYASFELPWVLEWYEAHRQYKEAYALLQDFPAFGKKP